MNKIAYLLGKQPIYQIPVVTKYEISDILFFVFRNDDEYNIFREIIFDFMVIIRRPFTVMQTLV